MSSTKQIYYPLSNNSAHQSVPVRRELGILPTFRYLFTSALIMALVLGLAYPPQALAFEATLPSAQARKLLAFVTLNRPYYDGRMTGVAVAQLDTEVELADWPTEDVLALAPEATLVVDERVYPTLDEPIVLEGEASYYSRAGCLGCSASLTMANGQPLDDNALTMAIGADKKHLVGYTATVTNLATGQSVRAKITDTGGFYKARYGHRVADLTVATKQAIGMRGGVGQVKVEIK